MYRPVLGSVCLSRYGVPVYFTVPIVPNHRRKPTSKVTRHSYGVDNLNRLTTVTLAEQNYTLDYTTANQLNSMLYPNGNRQSYTYEDHGPIKAITLKNSGDTILETLGYTYDANRNILTYSDKDGSHQFTYDGLDRLTQGDYPAASGLSDDSFAYDNVGNREVPGDLAANTYNANNELLSLQSGAVTFTYDDDGNQLNKTDTAVPANNRTYTYDLNNRLIGFSQGSTVASYGYGPSGRRLFKTVNGTTTWFLWDGTQLLAEYTTSGSTAALATRYDYLPGEFAPLQIETSNGTYSVHTDHLVTPKLLTDSSGQVVWRSVRAAFGETTVNDDVDGNGVAVGLNIRFPGQYFDGESGLHYNYFRDYDPGLGRYVESDPIGLMKEFKEPRLQTLIMSKHNFAVNSARILNHIYLYTMANPVHYFDYYGLVRVDVGYDDIEPIHHLDRTFGDPNLYYPNVYGYTYGGFFTFTITCDDGTVHVFPSATVASSSDEAEAVKKIDEEFQYESQWYKEMAEQFCMCGE